MDPHCAPPPELYVGCVERGTVIPCELAGPFALDQYHRNLAGFAMGFANGDARRRYQRKHRERLHEYDCWEAIDIYRTDADWAMMRGGDTFGTSFPFEKVTADSCILGKPPRMLVYDPFR